MSLKILVVKSENDFILQFNDLVTSSNEEFDITVVSNRKEAMNVLQDNTFDRIITALKIPRISDGYLFLSHALKTVGNDKVIVVVDEKSDEVKRSINQMGTKHLHLASDIKGLLNILSPEARSLSPVGVEKSINDFSPVTIAVDVEKVQDVLGLVMGPAGGMIFSEVMSEWQNSNDILELINLIEIEIDDESKVLLFRENLQ